MNMPGDISKSILFSAATLPAFHLFYHKKLNLISIYYITKFRHKTRNYDVNLLISKQFNENEDVKSMSWRHLQIK